jgi:para-nitrobenzyl esterase
VGKNCRASEDCLTLNIYAPHNASPDHPRPVMVWIYGGAFTLGANDQYDLSALADRQRVIVVAPNYRLGALGYLAHPALAGPGEGSYGLLDQQAALRWVKLNIRSFGGDPSAVTAFGQSAGAFSVCSQMTSPGAKGLFERVILQSGACVGKNSTVDRATAEEAGLEIADELGCKDHANALACLRALPRDKLARVDSRRLGLNIKNGWTPMNGGDVLPERADIAFATGHFTAVPMIDGTTTREGTLFAYFFALTGKLLSEQSFHKIIAASFPGENASILNEYGALAKRSRFEAITQIVTDARFACPALRMDQMLAGKVPVWAYEFDDPQAPFAIRRLVRPKLGPYHASDIAFVLQRPWILSGPLRFTPAQQELSNRMQDYWGTFARSGTPDSRGAPWRNFTRERSPMLLAARGEAYRQAFVERHRCAFWNKLGY